jgi:Ion channel
MPHRILGAIVPVPALRAAGNRRIPADVDLIPNSLSGVPSEASSVQASGALMYFSFVALTTIGFGDIVALHPFARGLANLEGVVGQLTRRPYSRASSACNWKQAAVRCLPHARAMRKRAAL